MQITGSISMPSELETLLTAIGDKKLEGNVQSSDINTMGRNKKDYLAAIPRKIDIMLMCVFYGLYSCKQLPQMDRSENKLNGSYEFNVGIDREVKHLRNILLMIWMTENRLTLDESIKKFRRELYLFLEKILDDEFLTRVVFPFYLKKATEVDSSLISKLQASRFVEWKMKPYAPERLALEFNSRKQEFDKFIRTALDSLL